MAVHSFATNNLVKERDVYVRYIKVRKEYIKKNNIHPEPHLFIRRKHLLNSINIDNMPLTSLQRAICKWHCMQLTYHIWHDLAGKCRVYNGTIGHKKTVHVPDDILKEFKKKVEKAIIDNNCDYNRRLPHTQCVYDACRYLAMYWTYLDIVKDEVSQRFYPDPDTWKRAAKIFGYCKDENPFQMNGMYFDWKQNNKEESMTPIDISKVIEKCDEKTKNKVADINEISLEDLDLSVRTENCLRRAGVKKFGSLLMLTANDILHIRNLGINSFREVVSKLQEYGYTYPEDKTNPRIPYVKDALPIKIKTEESVIDIAEEAARRVEEEKSSGNNSYANGYNALLEKYNKLNDDFDSINSSFLNATNKYDELLKQKLELESYNVRLRDEIEKLKDSMAELKNRETKLNIAANPKNLDAFTLLNIVLEKMKDSKMDNIFVTVNGMTVDIHPKQNVPFRSAAYQIRTSEAR